MSPQDAQVVEQTRLGRALVVRASGTSSSHHPATAFHLAEPRGNANKLPRMALSQPVLGVTLRRLGSLSPRRVRRLARAETIVLLGLLGAAVFGALLAASVSLHILLALAVLPLVLAVVWTSPRTTILGLVVWLVALGMVRRLLGSGSNTGLGDPLLLVGPTVLILLFVVACGRGALRARSPLANAVALLSLLALVEAVNPFARRTHRRARVGCSSSSCRCSPSGRDVRFSTMRRSGACFGSSQFCLCSRPSTGSSSSLSASPPGTRVGSAQTGTPR